MFYIMAKLQRLLNKARFAGVSHKIIDPIAQRLPFARYLAIIAVMLFACVSAHASGHISATYGRNPVDSLLGGSASYEKDFGKWDIEADAQIQSGDITESEAHVAVAFDVGPVQFKPFVELNAIRTEDWGYSRDGGAKINIPIGDSGVELALGGFLRGSQAFVPLQKGTRNPITGEVEWDDASILNFDNLGLINALFEVNLEWKRLDLGLSGIFDVSNKTFHQIIVDAGTGWQITPKVSIFVDGQYIEQPGDGRQVSFTSGVGYEF